ncbi:WxL protein host-binding domain-containing protein [Schleiferilactobacillus shenzhenensis]|nr:DUF3324 domain-containing protein [Schleiferilactobacillus shenzhenensis]
MRRRIGWWLVLLLGILWWTPQVVRADWTIEGPQIIDMGGRSVDKLTLHPGEQRTLRATLTIIGNQADVPVTFTAGPMLTDDFGTMKAQTDINGQRLVLDGAPNFGALVTGLPSTPVNFAPDETRTVTFTVTMPQNAAAGEVVAGYIGMSAKSDSLLNPRPITNNTELLVTVPGTPPTAAATISDPQPAEYQGRDGITVDVANHVGNILDAGTAMATVRSLDHATRLRRRTLTHVMMAPHSNFTLFIPHADLQLGKYAVSVSVGKVTQDFTVTVDRRLATATSKAEEQAQQRLQTILWWTAGGGTAVIVAAFGIIHWRRVRKER